MTSEHNNKASVENTRVQNTSIQGIPWMLLTMFFFVSMDATAKYLNQSLDVTQVIWARYFFHVFILTIILLPRLKPLLKTSQLPLQLGRSFLLLITTGLFFTGLKYISMADASATMLASPIIVTALSVPILKEIIGPRRWASIAVGLIGAIIILRPGTGLFQPASLFPLGAAVTYSFYQISTRLLNKSDNILTTLLYSSLLGTVVMTMVAPFYWQTPNWQQWVGMLGLGILGGLGHFTLIKSLTLSPASTVAPFTYSNMIWATLFGYIIFNDTPDQWTVIGALIISISGMYIFHRENMRNK